MTAHVLRRGRRRFLAALALAPAVVPLLAGCAARRAAPSSREPPPLDPRSAEPPRAAEGGPPRPPERDLLGPIRDHPLPVDTEPAFVFRALRGT